MSIVNVQAGLRGFQFSAEIGRPGTWDFFIIRHGESLGNRNKIIQGHADYPLTDEGRDHAAAAGEWFSSLLPDAILASPLERAWDTAQIIAREIGFPVKNIQPSDDLKEINTGAFTAKKAAELATQEPELWRRFNRESWEVVPDAERIPELEARATRVWKQLCLLAAENLEQPRQRILCVSHGGIMQWLIRTTFGSGWTSWMPVMKIGNCGIFQLRVEVADPDSKAPRMPGLDPATSGFSTEWRLFNYLPYT